MTAIVENEIVAPSLAQNSAPTDQHTEAPLLDTLVRKLVWIVIGLFNTGFGLIIVGWGAWHNDHLDEVLGFILAAFMVLLTEHILYHES